MLSTQSKQDTGKLNFLGFPGLRRLRRSLAWISTPPLMPEDHRKPRSTARYCVVTPYRRKPAAVTISPGHGIRLDLPNYAPGLAVMHMANLDAAREFAQFEKTRPYRIALTIGLCMLMAACSGPSDANQIDGAVPIASSAQKTGLLTEKVASNPAPKLKLTGSTQHLSTFYSALFELERGTRKRAITVLHLGDSHIAADRFSGDLRTQLQRRFGNAGRGLVQPGKAFKYFHARGIKTRQSEGWQSAQSHRGAVGPYSLTGVRLETTQADETLELSAKTRSKHSVVTVEFLSGPDAGSVEISAGGRTKTFNLKASVRKIRRFKSVAGVSSVSIKTLDDSRVSVLGWSADIQVPGVRYVSFGLPGASALVMGRWNKALVRDEMQRLKPDLIVLGYGTNEGFKDDLDFKAYRRRYEASARKLVQLSGGASLLMLGAPDANRLPKYARVEGAKPGCKLLSTTENSQYSALLAQESEQLAHWHAPANLGRVRVLHKQLAKKLNVAFWDWSQVMGGRCGTYRWAQATPALAYGDKVHFNDLGGRRTAAALFRYLMKGYQTFRNKANQRLRA